MKFLKVCSLALLISMVSCDQLQQIANEAAKQAGQSGPPTQSEIASGIKEALIVGAQNSVLDASKTNGFYSNSLIKIPFPPEAAKVEKTVRDLGLGSQVDKFVETLNHGAEQASKKAAPIFVSAIKQMTLRDVYDIWKGDNDAATQFLRRTTETKLKSEFRPVITTALDKVELTKYWNPVVNTYNQIPLVTKVNPDLDEYVLQESLDGLFLLIAQEEAKIRQDPAARVTDILQRVFGYNNGNY